MSGFAAGDTAKDRPLLAVTRDAIIARALELLVQRYVFLETAERMAATVRNEQAAGSYDGARGCVALCTRLEKDLRAVSNDRHLRVLFNYDAVIEGEDNGGEDATAALHTRLAAENFGISRVEILDGNIGYIDVRSFAPAEMASAAVAAAFTLVTHTAALLIDLRKNSGGEPSTVALISSYLLPPRIHLTDIHSRWDDRTERYWTLDAVSGPRYAGDVFLLTSARTFSAGEDFAYNMKQLKRATLVGERTGGGAHPVTDHRIHPHVRIRVPYARSINPITKSNWEGVGVEPDVETSAEAALSAALETLAQRRAQHP